MTTFYGLYSPTHGDALDVDPLSFAHALDLAEANGWQPSVTHPLVRPRDDNNGVYPILDRTEAAELADALTRALPSLSDAELPDDTDQTTATAEQWFTGANAKAHLREIVAFLTSHAWCEVVQPSLVILAD